MSVPSAESRASLRVSDADRDLVMNVLNSAYAEGRITHDELDERLQATFGAKTFGDLELLTADLMPSMVAVAQRVAPAAIPNRPAGVQIDPRGDHQSDRVVRVLGECRRTGPWRLAERTSIIVFMGEVHLDLREAIWASPVCEIAVQVTLGEVKVIVPDGVDVVSRVTTVVGEDKRKGMRPVPVGSPQLVLTGWVGMGEVTVIGPDHKTMRQRLGW